MPVTLETDRVRLTISPELGGSVMGLRALVAGRWVGLMPEPGTPGCDLAAASFIMAPYSNRIADGRFAFDRRPYQLQNGANHAIHGDVRKRPWRVQSSAASSLELAFRSAEHEGVNWPWPFDADLSYAVDGATITTTLVLTNRGDSRMPAGFGFHPYFLREPLDAPAAASPPSLKFRTTATYPDANGTRIPSGPAVYDPLADYTVDRPLLPGRFHDYCATGYDGAGHIRWPSLGLRLEFTASEVLSHLVVYNPPKPYFAVEPVSNANDGVNLLARGDGTSGVHTLGPGESMTGRLRWDVVTDP